MITSITGRRVCLTTTSVAAATGQRGTGECSKDFDDESRKSGIRDGPLTTLLLFTKERRDFPATLTVSVIFLEAFKPGAPTGGSDKMTFFEAFSGFASAFSAAEVSSPL
jgi:hypothetical protein